MKIKHVPMGIGVLYMLCTVGCAADRDGSVWITLPSEDRELVADALGVAPSAERIRSGDTDLGLIEVPEWQLGEVATLLHEKNHHCGGFVSFADVADARAQASKQKVVTLVEDYSISHQMIVNTLIGMVEEQKILSTIQTLSAYPTRYYSKNSGKEAALWLRDLWQGYVGDRPDAEVELWEHNWLQPSVVLTITGETAPEEVVVIGGHLDSTTGFFNFGNAPGADDDASGIATFSEVARLFLAAPVRPARTVKFIAYAAEEVGLRGSEAIANNFANNDVPVAGVLQLDMVGLHGSDIDVLFNESHTNGAQNQFLMDLMDEYLPELTWDTFSCGYACSDHASWHAVGYPAANPFEAYFDDHNSAIHSSGDTISAMGGDATHAAKFAKLTLAYVVELADASLVGPPPGPIPPGNPGPLPSL